MSTERVKCDECGSLILPATAARYGGLCATCGRMTAGSRRELAEHRRRLATGEVYRPSREELAAGRPSRTLAAPDADWKLEPDFYAGRSVDGVQGAIRSAEREPRGNVFLVSDAGAQLNLSFTEAYAVCTFRDADGVEFYARTPDCLDAQARASSTSAAPARAAASGPAGFRVVSTCRATRGSPYCRR